VPSAAPTVESRMVDALPSAASIRMILINEFEF
jgi:hypothetical protein